MSFPSRTWALLEVTRTPAAMVVEVESDPGEGRTTHRAEVLAPRWRAPGPHRGHTQQGDREKRASSISARAWRMKTNPAAVKRKGVRSPRSPASDDESFGKERYGHGALGPPPTRGTPLA
jgi:hypothetical protein